MISHLSGEIHLSFATSADRTKCATWNIRTTLLNSSFGVPFEGVSVSLIERRRDKLGGIEMTQKHFGRVSWLGLAIALMISGRWAWAEEPEDTIMEQEVPVQSEAVEMGEEAPPPPPGSPIYIPIKPPFVVNYGGAGRLRYIKAEVALRLDSPDAANSVRHHLPYIRNELVMLFASQTNESIASQEGKELLRQEALQAVREVIQREDGQEGIVDLYFTSFLIQK